MNSNTQDPQSAIQHAARPAALALAIAAIPMQSWETPYSICEALYHGTIFPSLDLPFYKTGGERRG